VDLIVVLKSYILLTGFALTNRLWKQRILWTTVAALPFHLEEVYYIPKVID